MPKLAVIVVSTRPGRVGLSVGKWFDGFAHKHGGFEVKLIDLAEINLPLLDEPEHPMLRNYRHDHTKTWSKLIEAADAFVFITPEYDYFAPATLVNAIDYLSYEWNYKPAGFVGYGSISGGLRAIQSAKPLLTSVKLMPLPESVAIQFVNEHLHDGVLLPTESHERSAVVMLDELGKWATALKPLRTNSGKDAPA